MESAWKKCVTYNIHYIRLLNNYILCSWIARLWSFILWKTDRLVEDRGVYVFVCYYTYSFMLLLSLKTCSYYFLHNPEVKIFILIIKTQILYISGLLAILMPSPMYLPIWGNTIFPFSSTALNKYSCLLIQWWDQFTLLLLSCAPLHHSRNKIQLFYFDFSNCLTNNLRFYITHDCF